MAVAVLEPRTVSGEPVRAHQHRREIRYQRGCQTPRPASLRMDGFASYEIESRHSTATARFGGPEEDLAAQLEYHLGIPPLESTPSGHQPQVAPLAMHPLPDVKTHLP